MGYRLFGGRPSNNRLKDKAIELNPHYAWAYYNRGHAHVCKAEYDETIADFTKAIELDPNYADA